MQYNIFKISKPAQLLKEMIEANYITNDKIIKSEGYELKLYYNKKDNSKISWQNVLKLFDVNITVDKDSLKGILIANDKNKMYAITYGMSSSLVQKYCDSEFPMNIAKRIEVSKVKRKASKILNGSTNSLVRTLTNSDVIVVDKGESVVNLEMVPDESEQLGKCIGIGKSVRINVDESIELINDIIMKLENINNRKEKRPIPLLVKVQNDELLNEIWLYLNNDFVTRIADSDFLIEDMNILGSSIYFDDCFKTELAFKGKKSDIPFLNTYYIKEFIESHNINLNDVYKYMKIKYISDDGFSFVRSLKEVVTFDLEYNEEKYVLYDGDIYYYNRDFYQNIIVGLKSIQLEQYNEKDDFSREWYTNYLIKNNLVDVKSENKGDKKSIYREQAINNELSDKYNYDNIDRNLVSICKGENYKIEISDLAKENEVLFAVKVGTPRDFCYAIDQSILALDAITSNSYDVDALVEKYKNVKKIGLWLFVTGNKKHYDNQKNIDLLSFDSIMFLNKLTEWSNKVLSVSKTPIIKVNYYRC